MCPGNDSNASILVSSAIVLGIRKTNVLLSCLTWTDEVYDEVYDEAYVKHDDAFENKMAKGDLKLLGTWGSPFPIRVRIALKLKSLEYEYQEENIRESKSELLLKSNPVYKKVPVLLHGDKAVCESLIIVQYIDEAWSDGPSILPSDPYDRAIARFWTAYVEDKIHPNMRVILVADGEEAKAAAVDQLKEALMVLDNALVKCSKGKPFFGGDDIGYVDIALGCFTGWLGVTEKVFNVTLFDAAATPHLLKWAEAFNAHPSVKDVTPTTDKLLDYATKFIFPNIEAVTGAAAN